MKMQSLVQIATLVQPVLCILALVVIVRYGQLTRFRFVAAYLAVQLLTDAVLLPVLRFNEHGITVSAAYRIYFYGYWLSNAVETVLSFCIVYQLFRFTLEPLRGLQRLGSSILRVLGAIALVAAIALSRGPHMTAKWFLMHAISQFQQSENFIAVVALLLVIVAIHPMGLSVRGKVFGVCLGLGVLAVSNLAITVFVALNQNTRTIAVTSLVDSASWLLAVLIWTVYLSRPEPGRRIVVLAPGSRLIRLDQAWLGNRQGRAI